MNRLGLPAFAAFLLGPACLTSQHLDPESQQFTANAQLVLVPVIVTDRRGSVVNGLERRNFVVAEDGVSQRIAAFSEEEAPASIGVVFDRSGSMRNVLPSAKKALKRLFDIANPEDEAFITAVSTRPQEHGGFSGNLGYQFSASALRMPPAALLSLIPSTKRSTR